MMKRFAQKFIPILILMIGSPLKPVSAFATPIAFDESAQDMLQASDENENEDTSSKWGSSSRKVRAEEIAIHPKTLAPIDESSFESGGNRAPASMRGPAAVKPVASKKKPLPASKTMVRALKQKKAYQEMAVIVNDLGFFPSTLFVTQGIPVRLYVTGASQRSQCMILDAFGVRRQIKSQKVEEVIFTPDQAGKFAFTCPMNGAKGAIVVKELELDRLPASEDSSVETSMVTKEESQKSDDESQINDEDFSPEFRVKP